MMSLSSKPQISDGGPEFTTFLKGVGIDLEIWAQIVLCGSDYVAHDWIQKIIFHN